MKVKWNRNETIASSSLRRSEREEGGVDFKGGNRSVREGGPKLGVGKEEEK